MIDPRNFPTRAAFDAMLLTDRPRAGGILLGMREAARRDLACFVAFRYFASNRVIAWNWHLDYLCDVLTAASRRELKRLIINIPPRFLKSELVSQCFPAWLIGRDDTTRSSVLSAAATAALAARDSRKTLEILKSDWYKAIFPSVEVAKETEVEWETKGGASRNAAGAEGTITGRGGDFLIWDDILLAKDAMSETVRTKVNEWLGETFRNRLNDQKDGVIIGIMQRLHELDPTGYLLQQQRNPEADQYTHIVLPNEAPQRTVVAFGGRTYAVREQGDLLHDARIGRKETAALKAAMRANYSGQYQQNPVKMEGGHLDPSRLLRLQGTALEIKSRLGLMPVFFIDFAATEKQTQKDDPDFSSILVGARDQLNRLIILDLWRRQVADYSILARVLLDMHKLWRPRFVKGERGALLNVFQPVLQQQMTLTGHFITLEPLPGRRLDKLERSMPAQGMLNAGMVAIPEIANWTEAFTSEMRGFPNAAHDDQMDPFFDLATDYQTLPRGEVPVRSPEDPVIILDNDIKARIEKKRNEELYGVRDDNDGWA